MEINQTTPHATHATLTADREADYLDVWTEEEFGVCHPAAAINVPIAFPNLSGGMPLNPDFKRLVESLFPRDKTIFCGCQAGGRSPTAGGVRDPSGQLWVAGWIDSGLPISTAVDEAHSYANLKQRAGL